MENKVFQDSTNDMVNPPEQSTEQQIVSTKTGSSSNFRGILEAYDYMVTRPLMVNAWTQTTIQDFSFLDRILVEHQRSQREIELEEKVRVLEDNLKEHRELLSHIHATTARTSVLLGQQQLMIPDNNNVAMYNPSANSSISGRIIQHSPRTVNAINSSQQMSFSSNESVKYRIIADGTGNHTNEPIEIQLAEDDGALNLNSSADSGRLQICLGSQETIEAKPECHRSNNIETQAAAPINPAVAPINLAPPNGILCIKNRTIAEEEQPQQQQQLLKINKNSDNIQQKPRNENARRKSANDPLQTPKRKRNKTNGPKQTRTPPSQSTSTTSPQSDISSTASSNNADASQGVMNLDNVFVYIGPNNTRIPASLYDNMNWSTPSMATRKLLMATFDRKVLATHSMTGKPSPAFKGHNKPVKKRLDPRIVSDIIFAVTRKCQVSKKEVRSAITTKCADENKMMKLQMSKQRTPLKESDKENIEQPQSV